MIMFFGVAKVGKESECGILALENILLLPGHKINKTQI